MEEKRTPDGRFSDSFLKEHFDALSDIKRLKEHEEKDKPKYEKWFEDIWKRLGDLEKLHLAGTNGRLRNLEARPIVVQFTEKEIKAFFDEWGKAWGDALAGRISFKLILWLAGTIGFIITALLAAAFLTYFGFKR